MTDRPVESGTAAQPWTCPFCPLLCDAFGVDVATFRLVGSDCRRAQAGLAQFAPQSGARFDRSPAAAAQARLDGQACAVDAAVTAAAQRLAASRQPLFAGMGCDVAGARALYSLALETGAICDSAQGASLMHGLRALQDRGAFTTTLAEVRTRADLIVCMGGPPTEGLPEFFRRCGLHESLVAQRHVVIVGGDAAAADVSEFDGLAGISSQHLPLQGDLFTTASVLATLVAGRTLRDARPGLVALAARLKAAAYGVIAWEAARLPAHGALVVEAINRIVGTLNRSTRAASLPLGGGDGAATVNQVFTWLSGLPMRSRLGPLGLEHEPLCFDTTRLLADGTVDAMLWISSFRATSPPPATSLPLIVLGPPALADSLDARAVFIPVSTPGIGSAGHVFRTDGVVLMPLRALRPDGLTSVADVIGRIGAALKTQRAGLFA